MRKPRWKPKRQDMIGLWMLSLSYAALFAGMSWLSASMNAPTIFPIMYGLGAVVIATEPLWMQRIDL